MTLSQLQVRNAYKQFLRDAQRTSRLPVTRVPVNPGIACTGELRVWGPAEALSTADTPGPGSRASTHTTQVAGVFLGIKRATCVNGGVFLARFWSRCARSCRTHAIFEQRMCTWIKHTAPLRSTASTASADYGERGTDSHHVSCRNGVLGTVLDVSVGRLRKGSAYNASDALIQKIS